MKVNKILVDGQEKFVEHGALCEYRHTQPPKGADVYEVELHSVKYLMEKSIVDKAIWDCENPKHEGA